MIRHVKLLACSLALVGGLATPALADSFVFNVSNGGIGPGNTGPFGTVTLTQTNANTVTISVVMGAGYALSEFGWNMAGAPAGLNITAAESAWGGSYVNYSSGGQMDGLGSYDYTINSGNTISATTTLTLTITRNGGGALSMADLEELVSGANGSGYFAAHVTPTQDGTPGCAPGVAACTGFAAANVVPEPASMVLFGTGLIAVASVRRFRSKK